MSSEDGDYIKIKGDVEEAYARIKTDSLVKNNKNLIDILTKFNSAETIKGNFGNNYGFNDVITKNNIRKNKLKNSLDSSKINAFLQTLGISESVLLEENRDRERKYTLLRFVKDNLPLLNQALDVTASSIMAPELIKTDVFVLDNLGESANIELAKRILEEFNLETKVEEWIWESLLLGDSFCEIIDTTTVIDELETQILKEDADLFYATIDDKISEDAGYSNAQTLLESIKVVKHPDDIEISARKLLMGAKELSESKDSSEETDDALDKVYLKTHKPENIIVIQVGDFVLGYLSIETENIEPLRSAINPSNTIFSGNTVQYKDKQKTYSDNQQKDSRTLIVDNLYEILLKQLDVEKPNISKFLKKNSEYYDLIYNIVTNKRKANIRFIAPDKMVHWKHKGTIYGDSIFESMLLLIKHYLAIMTHMTIFSLTRGVEKRKITVEVSSLDMDAGGALNNVVKSFKQKEQALINQINNIDSYSTEMTAYDDVFIPTINGESPIQIETIPGQDASIDTEYLENLKSNILNGIHVPKSLLNEVENSYRTSLAQENIMFAMQIINKQKLFEPILNSLIMKILKIVSTEKVVKDFKVKFNPPTTLLNESLSNNISNASSIVDFVMTTYSSDDAMGTGSTSVDRSDVAKLFIKGIDWETLDRLKGKKLDKENKDKISGINQEEDMMGDFGGGDFGGGQDNFDAADEAPEGEFDEE